MINLFTHFCLTVPCYWLLSNMFCGRIRFPTSRTEERRWRHFTEITTKSIKTKTRAREPPVRSPSAEGDLIWVFVLRTDGPCALFNWTASNINACCCGRSGSRVGFRYQCPEGSTERCASENWRGQDSHSLLRVETTARWKEMGEKVCLNWWISQNLERTCWQSYISHLKLLGCEIILEQIKPILEQLRLFELWHFGG